MKQQSETTGEITKALVKLQAELSPVKRQSKNPFLGKKYADLATCWEAARDPLSKNGLAVVQTTEPGEDGSLVVITTLAHTSGEWYRGFLPVKPVKADPQALGSAITYGRRYSFAAIIGLAPEDDDAESAMARQQGQQKGQAQKPAQGKAQTQQQSKPQQQPKQAPPAQAQEKSQEQKQQPAQGNKAQGGEEPATTPQQQKLNILLEKTVGKDRTIKIQSVNEWLAGKGSKKQISTSKELTKRECSELIETLQNDLDEAKNQQTRQPMAEIDDLPF